MPEHRVGTREEWQAERDELLEAAKELTRGNDELTERRQALPWVPIEKEYSFETEDGTKSLQELFDGRSQLLIYHFMFGDKYEAGCPACSSIADTLSPQVPHLAARDVTMICVSSAPLDKLLAYRDRMGWSFTWASGARSDFNTDLGHSHTEEEVRPFIEGGLPPVVDQFAAACGTDATGYIQESPGLSVFALDDGAVYQTYAATDRALEPTMAYYFLLDRAPLGRQEKSGTEHWLRRHDEY
jgi:predicted dithiol-disulfide oxidoreductase (DUF899 family)